LFKAGSDINAEDHMQHNTQYYMDHPEELNMPKWQPKWTVPQPSVSPTPRKKIERKSTSTSPTKKKSSAPTPGNYSNRPQVTLPLSVS
jgi:hypothetical protein